MPNPGIITPSYSDKQVIERLIWTTIHWQTVEHGRQARRWLYVLAGRFHQVEARFPTAMAGQPAHQVMELAYAAARAIKRIFMAADVPLHLRALRELQRRPFDRWEHVNWWSGTAKITHRHTAAPIRGRR